MSDAPQFPAGWYADPENPTQHRWWDGTGWTDARQSAYPATPPAAPAPQLAEPPAPPAYTPPTSAPPVPQAAYPAYPTAPYVAEPEVRRDIPTGTVWIWLVILLPLISLPTLFLFDWSGYIDDVVRDSMNPTGVTQSWAMSFTAGSLGITALGYLVVAAQILFAFLDWRTLRKRGVERPFHWAWIFFALVITNGIYVIGRGVVLRRRTGGGLGPVWAWIAVTVLSLAVGIAFAVFLFSQMITVFENEGLFTSGITAP